MHFNIINKEIKLEDGRVISLETGKLARQADGSVVVSMGKTKLLATVVSSKEAKEGVDFLPLSVDYQEKFAASGKIPGGFLKREGKLSDYEVLVCRLVDRVLRPMFPGDYHADTQVFIQLISSDENIIPDTLAALAASAALAVSDIPFDGPISEVRVGKVNGEFKINPSSEELENSDLDIMVGGTADNVSMVEGEMHEISEEELADAILFAHEAIKNHCAVLKELEKEAGTTEKRVYSHETHDESLREKIHQELYDKVYEVVSQKISDKHKRSESIKAILDEYLDALPEDSEEDTDLAKIYFKEVHKRAARNLTLNTKERLDGRQLDEVRDIEAEVDYLPSAHGSALFTRGETQSLTSCTLGTKLDEQMIDGAVFSGHSKFILHYNFPGFSTGEVRPNRGPGRREVGHGNLAQRALKKVMPSEEENPYTIRIVSDILESNGSSSMATVCAGSLALMDAGVKFSKGVSGIAMGLISDEESGNYAVLSDILGDEDHLGDMDFKVAGTRDGLTACQMDIKIKGLSKEILINALEQSKKGRLHILDKMEEALKAPREDFKEHAPRFSTVKIKKDQIGLVIGPGGKMVQEIQKESGATVVIEEKDDHGVVNVFAADADSMNMAVNKVQRLVEIPEVGKTYTGKVKTVKDFGAFIEFLPGKDGLLHISEIKWEKVPSMEGIFEENEEVMVKLIDIDKRTGKFKLSRKVLLPKPEEA